MADSVELQKKIRKRKEVSGNVIPISNDHATTIQDTIEELSERQIELTESEKEVVARSFVEEFEEGGYGACIDIVRDEKYRRRYFEYLREKRERKSYKSKYKHIGHFFQICDRYKVKTPSVRIPNIFWEVEVKGKNKQLKLDRHALTKFLNYHGFYKFYYDDMSFKYCRSIENMVCDVSDVQIKEFVLEYVEELKDNIVAMHRGFAFTKVQLMQVLKDNVSKLFNKDLLETLKNLYPKDFVDRHPDKAFFFFKNGFVAVDSESWVLEDYKNLKKLVWKNQIIDKTLSITKEPPHLDGCVFRDFIYNVCKTVTATKQEDRVEMLMTIIGYMLHDYDNGKRKAVVFTDEASTEEEANGRSGKSLLSEAIGYLRSLVSLDGKDFTYSNTFKWQEVNYDTQIVCVDDAKRNFKIEDLFHNITQGVSINKKNTGSFKIKAKFMITINSVVRGEGGSARDRIVEFPFSNHYKEGYSPADEFGHWFFRDWDEEQWGLFFAFMMDCSRKYFSKMKEDPHSMGLNVVYNDVMKGRHLEAKTDKDFIEFMQMFEAGDFKDINNIPQECRDGLYGYSMNNKFNINSFCSFFFHIYPDHVKARSNKTTQRKFTYWMKVYCNEKGYYLDLRSYGGKRYYEIYDHEPEDKSDKQGHSGDEINEIDLPF